MKAIIICPSDRPQVGFLARLKPLALVPVLGRSLLDLMIMHLAGMGAKHITVLAADRPDEVRNAIGMGEAWGVVLEVIPEQWELTVEQARAKYHSKEEGNWLPQPNDVVLLDYVPPFSDPLFNTCSGWFKVVCSEMKREVSNRLGMRELYPGVFAGSRSHISPSAKLTPPCWIGNSTWIGPDTVIGPNTIIESGCYIDQNAEVVESHVGPNTYVGALISLKDSFAWGTGLMDWKHNSFIEIVDAFVLCNLKPKANTSSSSSWPARILALMVMCLTSPVLLVAWIKTPRGQSVFQRLRAVRAPILGKGEYAGVVKYYQLGAIKGIWRRWPELWNIVRGQFRWVGSRPISQEQADTFHAEFERMWLVVPTGLFSLADAMGCHDEHGDEAKVHASYYAADTSPRKNAMIIWNILRGTHPSQKQAPPEHQTLN